MDREKKLLYIVLILAPITELALLFALYRPELPERKALLAETVTCQQRLFRCWDECSPNHFGPRHT